MIIVNVYSSCILDEKRMLWEKLRKMRKDISCNMRCMARDFSMVTSVDERKGKSPHSSQEALEVLEFNRFVEDLELVVDVPIVGGKFMWISAGGKVVSRLDKCLTCAG